MKKKLSEQLTLRLSGEMHSDLLKIAGSAEEIPELIRRKLAADASTSASLLQIQKTQEILILILTDLSLDVIPGLVRMRKIVQGFEDSHKREAELAEVRTQLENKIKKIQSYKDRV